MAASLRVLAGAAAQLRGEVASHGGDRKTKVPDANLESIGLTHKEVHEARQIRDAEAVCPLQLVPLVPLGGATLVFSGGELPLMKECVLNGAGLDFEGAADKTVQFFRWLKLSGMQHAIDAFLTMNPEKMH